MEKEVERWYKKNWKTKGSRFIAAHRLELHDKWSIITVSLFSVYIILLNLLVLIPLDQRLSVLSDVNITYSTISSSVLILTISLIIYTRNYKLRADRFHECGRKIDELHNEICIWKNNQKTPSKYDLEIISDKYSKILDKYENHIYLDFLLFKARNSSEFVIKSPWWFRFKTNMKFYLQTVAIYLLIIFTPILLLLFL